jgi:hypothetical protein
MTIKQQGGVFGRHPTFSTAEVDGDFSAGGTLYVDEANERVGINTSTPTDALEVSGRAAKDGSDPVTVRVTSLTSVGDWTAGADWARLEFRSADTSSAADPDVTLSAFVSDAGGGQTGLRMYTTNANSFTRKMQIWPAGGVSVGSNPTVDPGAGNMRLDNGNLVIGTSGKGIDFSATAGTGTSELFDDYEEGTWTPTYLLTTTDFDSITYDAVRYGAYTKIGNKVFCTVSIRTDAITVGAGTGSLAIGGLPFTVATGGANNASSGLPGYYASWASNPGGVYPTAGQTYAIIGVPGTTTNATSAILNTGANSNFISLQLFYTAA